MKYFESLQEIIPKLIFHLVIIFGLILNISITTCFAQIINEAPISDTVKLDGNIKKSDNILKAPVISMQSSQKIRKPLHKLYENVKINTYLTIGGFVIENGLVLPRSLQIEPSNIADQLALISPKILATGLEQVGTISSCRQVSKAVKLYQESTNKEPPRENHAWKLYYSGWGLVFVSSLLSVSSVEKDPDNPSEVKINKNYQYGAVALSVASELTWIATNLYCLRYVKSLEKELDNSSTTISIVPINTNNTYGLALNYSW